MSKVFVPQHLQSVVRDEVSGQVLEVRPTFNLMPAEEYGEVVILLDNAGKKVSTVEDLLACINIGLDTFNDEDYILPIGKPAMIGMTIAIAAIRNKGKFKLLQWDKKNYCYNPTAYDFSTLQNLL